MKAARSCWCVWIFCKGMYYSPCRRNTWHSSKINFFPNLILMNNIIACLGAHAAAHPHTTAFAILDNGEEISREISYGQLQSKVVALASTLASKQLHGK